jgi:hypothetical protein
MKDVRNSLIKLGAVILLIVFGLIYISTVAAPIQSEIDALRFENKTLKRDMAEIDAMRGDLTVLETSISELTGTLDGVLGHASVTAENAERDVTEKIRSAGLESVQITLAQPVSSDVSRPNGYDLNKQSISLVLQGSYAEGLAFLGSVETSETAIYRIEQFAFFELDPEADSASNGTADKSVKPTAAQLAKNTSGAKDKDADAIDGQWIINLTLYFYGPVYEDIATE